jgi:putative glutamine amidotransferase
MTRPLIGITGRRWAASRLAEWLPASFHTAEFDLHFTDYPAAIARAGGIPVELTRDAPVADCLARLDGVVISGGADVDPAHYGATPDPNLGTVEPERDDWELAVIAEAMRIDLPLLGICRGAQLIHVHLGGTLVQHLELSDGDGHPNFDEPRNTACHNVHFTPGTLAHRLYGDEASVNSLHHQVLEAPIPAHVVSARAGDGVIEAIEIPGRPVFAVQWHPESLSERLDPSLSWLIETATAYHERQASVAAAGATGSPTSAPAADATSNPRHTTRAQ